MIEAAEIRDQRRAADVGERPILGRNVKPTVRDAALRIFDVVTADGDVEPAVLVHVTDTG